VSWCALSIITLTWICKIVKYLNVAKLVYVFVSLNKNILIYILENDVARELLYIAFFPISIRELKRPTKRNP